MPAKRGRSSGRFGTVVMAFAAGIAGGGVGLALFPAATGGARPAAKRAMKAALTALERGREVAAEFGEMAGDVLAEAKAELEEERAAQSGRREIVPLRAAGGGAS